jgi:glyoxylase-like metal-dependent hydrolase (beta-lactamase superfamily II)
MHRIAMVRAGIANAFLVAGKAPIIVDSGPALSRPVVADRAKEFFEDAAGGAPPAALILTHAHLDHYGGAQALLAAWPDLAIVCGEPDAAPIAKGENAELIPLRAKGAIVAALPIHQRGVPGLVPTRLIAPGSGPMPLAEDGDALLVPTPGHTSGSLTLVIDDVAIAGDLIMGGMLFPKWLGWPFYGKEDAIRDSLRVLKGMGVRQFLIGHGGPFDAEIAWRKFRV